MVEQEAVNFEVASSSLASRAKETHPCKGVFFFGSLGPAPNGNPNDFSRWKVASSLILEKVIFFLQNYILRPSRIMRRGTREYSGLPTCWQRLPVRSSVFRSQPCGRAAGWIDVR